MNPKDFVRIIQENVRPVRNRILKVELMSGSLDYKKYYEQYGVNVGGLVPAPRGKEADHDVNHCWRFIRRSDLPLYDDHKETAWKPIEIPGESYSMSDADCVMLVKHLVNSVSLSQAPLVFLPESFSSYLKEDLQAMPRNILQDRGRSLPLDQSEKSKCNKVTFPTRKQPQDEGGKATFLERRKRFYQCMD
ncbi:unnamed protein product, partial [Effrenium voratum]